MAQYDLDFDDAPIRGVNALLESTLLMDATNDIAINELFPDPEVTHVDSHEVIEVRKFLMA